MAGLKHLWGLGDPAALDAQVLKQFETQIEAFSRSLTRLNESLRDTAAFAPPASHEKLVLAREALIGRYHKGLTARDAAALADMLTKAGLLEKQAAQIADAARAARARWDDLAPTLTRVEQAASESNDDHRLSQGLERIAAAIKDRDYTTACEMLVALANAANIGTARGAERRYPLHDKLPDDPVVPRDPSKLAHWNNPLVTGSPEELFTAERMDAVIEMQLAGAGSTELNRAMRALLEARPGDDVSHHLAAIGQQRGLEPQVVQQQFERFAQLQSVAIQLQEVRGQPPDGVKPPEDKGLPWHDDFLGQASNLRFGQVVGEATGLDPAFAALLDPTGGMIGRGADVLTPVDANSPIICNDIYHDAYGYLATYQNMGLGTDLLQAPATGVSHWYERQQPGRSLVADLSGFDFATADPHRIQLMRDRYVKHPGGDAKRVAENLTEDAVDEVRELAGAARDRNRNTVKSLQSSARRAAGAVHAGIEQTSASVDALAQQAHRLGVDTQWVAAAQTAIQGRLGDAYAGVTAWDQGIAAALAATGQFVDDQLADLDRWAEQSRAALHQIAGDLSSGRRQAAPTELVQLAQEQDLQKTVQTAVNRVAETKHDVARLMSTASAELQQAKQQVIELHELVLAQGVEGAQQAVQELAGLKNHLIDKFSTAQQLVDQAVDDMTRGMEKAVGKLAEAGQELLDTAIGLQDPLADAVGGGTDTLANTFDSATDFAADSLDRLAKLLG